MHRGAQRADALTVDNAHPRNALLQAQLDVVWHQVAHFRRAESMQVELVADLKFDRIWFVVDHRVSQVGVQSKSSISLDLRILL